jgi:hypothetical protein
MSTAGPLQTRKNLEQSVSTLQQRSQEMNHVERHYKTIGIGAIASALSVMKREVKPSPAPRDVPAFLRKENLAA